MLAVIVYAVDVTRTVGVPEIAPVVLDSTNPMSDNKGEEVKEVGVPPSEVAVFIVMALPR